MIDADTMAHIAQQVAAEGLCAQTMARLRARWPGLHFTLCGEDDVPARRPPQWRGEGFGLWLVGSDGFCLAYTDRPEASTGVVVAPYTEGE